MSRRQTRPGKRPDVTTPPAAATVSTAVKSWQLIDGATFLPVTAGAPSAQWVGDSTLRWIDVQTPDPAELTALLAAMGTPATIIELATDFDAMISDAHAERDAAWLRIPVPTTLSEQEHRFITVVALPSVLITHHRRPLARLEKLEALLVRVFPEGTSSTALVLEVLEEFSAEDLRAYVRTRHEVDQLARTLDERPEEVTLEQIAALMRRVDLLSMVCEDHLLAVSLLPQLESQAFRTTADRSYIAEVTRTLDRYQYGLKRAERRLEGLRQLYVAGLQEKANQRLRVLTVMSTIFLPMTLLASIYGMNFQHMPELASPYGYPAVLAAMVTIAGGQIWWYRRRGWWG